MAGVILVYPKATIYVPISNAARITVEKIALFRRKRTILRMTRPNAKPAKTLVAIPENLYHPSANAQLSK